MNGRTPNFTLILPGFLQVSNADGVAKIVLKKEVSAEEAGRIMNSSADTAKRMAEEGVLFARRKSHRRASHWVFCAECCACWRERNQPCSAHLSAESRAVDSERTVDKS